MKRRTFLQNTAVMGGAVLISPSFYKVSKDLGVQLWSVRDFMFPNPVETLQKVGEMGYDFVEGAGYDEGKFYGMTPGEFKKQLKDASLKMPSGHYRVGLEALDESTGQLTDALKLAVDSCAEVGQKHMVCSYIVPEQRDLESIKKLADIFNKTGELCKEAGMQFGYHNHDFEFEKSGDRYVYDYLLATDADLVKMQLDLYWVVFAGEDPVKWIDANPGRFISYHVKDMADSAEKETIEVGEGTIDFASIFKHNETSGVKYYIVELEHYKRPSIEGIEVSLNNLKKII